MELQDDKNCRFMAFELKKRIVFVAFKYLKI